MSFFQKQADLALYELLTEKEAANLLHISVSKLQKDRVKGVGLPFVAIGKCVRYRLSHILEFIEANTKASTSHAQCSPNVSPP